MTKALTGVLGLAAAITLVLTAWMALVVTPADIVQADAVRLLYLHVPTAWVAMYLSFGVTSMASALYLWPRTRSRFCSSATLAGVASSASPRGRR